MLSVKLVKLVKFVRVFYKIANCKYANLQKCKVQSCQVCAKLTTKLIFIFGQLKDILYLCTQKTKGQSSLWTTK